MRTTIIAGNWKMNTNAEEAIALATGLVQALQSNRDIEVVLCPPFPFLSTVKTAIASSPLKLGAQNLHHENSGAFTGEVSGPQLQSIGCDYVIIGHSERREYCSETNALTNLKIQAAFKAGLKPILCVGETLEHREQNVTFPVIEQQLREALFGLTAEIEKHGIVVAYEPVWAIGTGKVATTAQAQEVHRFIRDILAQVLSKSLAENIQIQYGGSVKPDNAKELLAQPDIDGALVGGASLKADSFAAIITAAQG